VHGRCSVIPACGAGQQCQSLKTTSATHQVAPSCFASFHQAVASKPAHMMALPQENMGAHRLRTIPPTWNKGIMFTARQGKIRLAKSHYTRMDAPLTVNRLGSEVPRVDDTASPDDKMSQRVRDDLLLARRSRSMQHKTRMLQSMQLTGPLTSLLIWRRSIGF